MERILRIALLMVLSVVTLSIQSQNRKATFPGGQKALAHFIDTRIDRIDEYRVVYRTVVVLRIDQQGRPSISKFIKVVDKKKEIPQAKRIVRQMPKWKPALRNGRPVVSYITLKFPMGNLTDVYLSQLYRDGKVCDIPNTFPEYIPIGNQSLKARIGSYLGKSKEKGRGRVYIFFIVNKDGSISNAQIRHPSNNAYLDKKVLDVIKWTRWKPATFRGEKVRHFMGTSYEYPGRQLLKPTVSFQWYLYNPR